MIYRKPFIIVCCLQFIPAYFSLCTPSSKQCGCSPVKPIFTASKIVGGFTARPNSWPWMVSLRQSQSSSSTTKPGSAFCGGVLVSDKYVLTAAHCVNSIKSTQLAKYFVTVGAQYINDTNPVRFTFKAIFSHPKYNDETYDNDIALVELVYRVDFNESKVGFICLPPVNQVTYPYAGMNATAVGWGRLEQSGTSSYSLQQVQLPIIPYTNQHCSNVVQNDTIQFCAGFVEGGKDTCQGDSGGPLMTYDANSDTWIIAGVTSYGYGCALPEYPGVYCRVSMYMNWINAYLNGTGPGSRASLQTVSPETLSILLFISLLLWK